MCAALYCHIATTNLYIKSAVPPTKIFHLANTASSLQIVNSIPVCWIRSIQSGDIPASVNRRVTLLGLAKEVRSSLPNLDESTRAYNICDDSITFRLICASA